MIDVYAYDILTNNRATLKELSKDTSGDKVVYMTESSIDAIDFDHVKTEYTNRLKLSEESASSVDALACIGSNCVFVEFKNGNMQSEKRKVKNKVRDSLLVLCDIIKRDISFTRENMSFILVYNKEKNTHPHNTNSRCAISEHIMKQANIEEIRFGLDIFQTLYFKEVHTYNEDEFEAYLSRNIAAVTK